MNNTTLLIDGDILIWTVSVVSQETIDFGEGVEYYPDPDLADMRLDGMIEKWKSQLWADNVIVTLSDIPSGTGRRQGNYWRHDILPSYKQHRPERESKQPPLHLFDHVRNRIINNYSVEILPRCEADDVMGILATSPHHTHLGDRIIVSIDKDMRQVPGKLWNPKHPDAGVIDISVDDADRWHFMQALVGDTTDNYKGCPGIGPKKAEALLAAADSETNGLSNNRNRWLHTLLAFASRGLGMEEALVQMRVSRILRHGEHETKLWEPPNE